MNHVIPSNLWNMHQYKQNRESSEDIQGEKNDKRLNIAFISMRTFCRMIH